MRLDASIGFETPRARVAPDPPFRSGPWTERIA
jgi:hypothetical protein